MISISLIVVLLASYSYSLPVPPQIQSSTTQIPFTTGQTIVGVSTSTNGNFFPGSQTTSGSSIKPETTTLNSQKVQGHVPRGVQQSTVLTSTVPLSTSSQTIVNNKLNQFSSTTMETKASFNKKAIDGETADLEEEQTESKRAVSSSYVRPSSTISYSTPISSTTVMNGIIGQTSSPRSFGKMTGQMKNKRGEYYEQDEQKREFDQEQQDEQQDEQKREFDQEQQDEQQDEQKREFTDEQQDEQQDEQKREFTDEQQDEQQDEQKREFNDEQQDEHQDQQKREFNDEQQDEQQDEQKREFNDEQQDEQQDEQKREFNDEQQDEQQDEQKREFNDEQQDEQQDEQKREFDQEQQDDQQDEQKRAVKEHKSYKQRKPYSGGQPSYEKGGNKYGEKQPVVDKKKSNY